MATRELIPHLELIAAARKHYVKERKSQTPIEALRALASMQKRPLPVLTTVASHQSPIMVIAQIRVENSDTAGIETLAKNLVEAGADALALFTDHGLEPHGLDDLVALTRAVNVPIISQDVFIDEYQIVEVRAAGASGLVLRASTLSQELLRTLVSSTQRNRMTAIVEVNNFDEIIYAQSLSPYVIAISRIDAWTGASSNLPVAELRAAIAGDTRVILAESLVSLDDVKAAVDLQVHAVILHPDLLLNAANKADLFPLLRRNL